MDGGGGVGGGGGGVVGRNASTPLTLVGTTSQQLLDGARRFVAHAVKTHASHNALLLTRGRCKEELRELEGASAAAMEHAPWPEYGTSNCADFVRAQWARGPTACIPMGALTFRPAGTDTLRVAPDVMEEIGNSGAETIQVRAVRVLGPITRRRWQEWMHAVHTDVVMGALGDSDGSFDDGVARASVAALLQALRWPMPGGPPTGYFLGEGSLADSSAAVHVPLSMHVPDEPGLRWWPQANMNASAALLAHQTTEVRREHCFHALTRLIECGRNHAKSTRDGKCNRAIARVLRRAIQAFPGWGLRLEVASPAPAVDIDPEHM